MPQRRIEYKEWGAQSGGYNNQVEVLVARVVVIYLKWRERIKPRVLCRKKC